MSRKGSLRSREAQTDPKYNDPLVSKFINTVLQKGKKSIAERIVYGAFDIAEQRVGQEGIQIFKKAVENVKPLLELKSRRVGGATYQVPIEVKPARRQSLACRWIIDAARSRSEHSLSDRLANELLEATNGRGGAMKKRDDVHRMAEANKVFAHFRW